MRERNKSKAEQKRWNDKREKKKKTSEISTEMRA